ncbi:MAG TPA: WD40 repeat domain-containing protein [Opitutaceae bacterium]
MQLTKHWAAVLDDYAIDLAWSPDGLRLAAASAAGSVSIFQLQGGEKLHVLPGHENGSNCIAWAPLVPGSQIDSAATPSLLATGGQDGQVKFWDANAGQHLASAKVGPGWVEQVAWRPRVTAGTSTGAANELCLAASAGKQFSLFNADGSVRHAFKPAPKTISALSWHPRGGCVAVAYFGGVCLWDSDDFVVQKEFPYGNGIHALTWSPDGKWLVSGNQDPSVHLWIPETDVELHMSGYEGKVKSLSFDSTSHWLATSGGQDSCLWDCSGEGPEGREPVMLPHQAKTSVVAFQNSHGLLATASEDGAVMVWSPERRQPLRATIKMPNAATKLVWSPNDQFLAIGSEQGAIYVLKCEA